MFVWKTFKVLSKSYQLADSISRLVERQMEQLGHRNATDIYEYDNQRCVCYYVALVIGK